MITKGSIKAIHAAATRAGLLDSEYRGILADVGRRHGMTVTSCKHLPQRLVGEALEAIKQRQQKRAGWQPSQLKRLRTYQALANLSDTDLRLIVHEVSGQMHEESPKLTQYYFDRIMIRLEMRVADAVASGDATWPAGYQPCYWRGKNKPGRINDRQKREIKQLWSQLLPYLDADQRHVDYLHAIASHGCGRVIKDIWSCSGWQAGNVIDALKDRLRYAFRKASGD